MRAQLDAFREQNISGPVVVFPWKSPRSRAERLNLGMNIRHEFTHARGGGEFTARIAEWQYLKRNGIPVDDLKPLQIVRELERLHSLGVYSEEHLHGAYDEFRASSTPSESTDFLADLTRRARWKSFVCRIGTLFGRKGEAFGSSESRYLDRLAHEASKA